LFPLPSALIEDITLPLFSSLLETKTFWFPLRSFSLHIFLFFPLHPDSAFLSSPLVSFPLLFSGCRGNIHADMGNQADRYRPSNCPSVNNMLQLYSPLRLSSTLIKQKDYFEFR